MPSESLSVRDELFCLSCNRLVLFDEKAAVKQHASGSARKASSLASSRSGEEAVRPLRQQSPGRGEEEHP